jgi:hypothetical protein
MSRIIIPRSGQLLLQDAFSGADGTALHGRQPDGMNAQGAYWVKAHTYDMELLSGELIYLQAVGGEPTTKDNDHYIDLGASGFTVECDLKIADLASTVAHSVVVRYINNLNSIAVQWEHIGGLVHGIAIREQVGVDASTEIAGVQFPDTIGLGEKHTMRIVDDSESLTVTLLGETLTVDTIRHNRATRFALRTDNKNGQTWDNLRVWKT